MSIDRYFAKIDGEWIRIDNHGEMKKSRDDITEFWVDICHGANSLTDERYYFPNFASALDFYEKGWKERQFLWEDGTEMGLDHIGLCSGGCLIHGFSKHGDAPGHEGENLRRICNAMGKMLEDENEFPPR